jgi:hypothetical protein
MRLLGITLFTFLYWSYFEDYTPRGKARFTPAARVWYCKNI